jgi:hypothetical protein
MSSEAGERVVQVVLGIMPLEVVTRARQGAAIQCRKCLSADFTDSREALSQNQRDHSLLIGNRQFLCVEAGIAVTLAGFRSCCS